MARLAGFRPGYFSSQAGHGRRADPCSSLRPAGEAPVLRKQYCRGLSYAQDFEAADIAAFNGRKTPTTSSGARSPPAGKGSIF